MRLLITGLMLATLTSLAPLGDQVTLNPAPLSGLVPWNSPEVSVRKYEGRWVAAFTGGRDRQTAIYLRAFNPADNTWSEIEAISPVDAKADSQPSFWIDSQGGYHCVWTTRERRGVYRILYSRREAGDTQWSPPHLFSQGSGSIPAHLLGDDQDNLFIYYWNNSREQPRARIFAFVSHDRGRNWTESSPNFLEPERKGKASHPQASLLADGSLGLVWLDQSPGGVSVVFNRAAPPGDEWFPKPVTVNSDRTYAARHPRLLVSGKRIHVLWTVRWLRKEGAKTQLWTAHSLDQGRNFSHNHLLYEASGDSEELELFAGEGEQVGVVWTEKFSPKADRTPGGGSIRELIFWDGERYLDSPEASEIATSREYFFSDLKVASRGNRRLVLASDLNPFKPSRVRILSRAGDQGWDSLILEAKTPNYDARGPIAFVEESDPVYIIVFHEVRRRRFIMEPTPWETSILWGQYQFQDSTGAKR